MILPPLDFEPPDYVPIAPGGEPPTANASISLQEQRRRKGRERAGAYHANAKKQREEAVSNAEMLRAQVETLAKEKQEAEEAANARLAEKAREIEAKQEELIALRIEADRIQEELARVRAAPMLIQDDEAEDHRRISQRSTTLFLEPRIVAEYSAGATTYRSHYEARYVLPFLRSLQVKIDRLQKHLWRIMEQQVRKIDPSWSRPPVDSYTVRNLWEEHGLHEALQSGRLGVLSQVARDRLMRFLAIAESCPSAAISGVFHGMRITKECPDVADAIFKDWYDYGASYRKFKDFPTAFFTINPLVALCYPQSNEEKHVLLGLKIELDEPSSYTTACTVQTSGVSPNGDAAVLPLAELVFTVRGSEDPVRVAMSQTMQYVKNKYQNRPGFGKLKTEIVDKALIESIPGLYVQMFRDMVLLFRGTADRVPPPVLMRTGGLRHK